MDGFQELIEFLTSRLQQPLPGPNVHRRFAPRPHHQGWRPDDRPAGARHAAALLLLYPAANGAAFPLTVRRTDLPVHPGQVSLPGGRINPDESAHAAALRESEEEIGVDASAVTVLGALSSLWVIVSNHVVQPFVGISMTRPDFRPSPSEVAALVEMPLADLHDLRRLKWEQRTRDGVLVDVPFFDLDGYQVWGATAMILGEFGALFDPDFAPGAPKRQREGGPLPPR
jgi:8-oxo-dGTP pyrophosphatase MutT (NUDIX family)